MEIKIMYHNPKCKIHRAGDWVDCKSAVTMNYHKGDFILIPLGFSAQLPTGYEAHLLPRSSTFKRYHFIMTNSMGIIDEDYNGPDDVWAFPAYCLADGHINEGDRFCQFRLMRKMGEFDVNPVTYLNNESRGGFGGTGV